MAATILVKSILESLDSTVDNASIGLVFDGSGTTSFGGLAPVFTALETFWNSTYLTQSASIAHYISEVMSRSTNASQMEVYDITGHLDGSPHGAPVAIHNWTLGTTDNTTSYPEGVAATVSFRADYGTDVEFGPGTRPRARDRNRVYIGPLNGYAFTTDVTTHRCLLDPTFVSNLLKALNGISQTIDLSGGDWNLRVWSRKNAGVKVPTTGFMDNRPDYQRRRSDPAPGTRVYQALAAT